MSLNYVFVNDTLVVFKPKGRMDMVGAREFETSMNITLRNKKINILFDLTDVEYVSSSFLRVIITTNRITREHDKEFAICNPNDFCKKVMELVRIDKVVNIYENTDEAITYLNYK